MSTYTNPPSKKTFSNGPISKYIHKNMHINEPKTTILNSEHLNKQAKTHQIFILLVLNILCCFICDWFGYG